MLNNSPAVEQADIFIIALLFCLHADDCQDDNDSCVESIGAPVKRYTLIVISVKCA